MSQVANLFQYYQKWVFEEKKNSQKTPIKTSESITFIFYLFIYFFFALRTKQNSSKDASVTYF